MAKQKEERIKIITPEFRGSYPAIFEARKVKASDPNEKAKFSILMLFRTAETPESKARGEKVVDLTDIKKEVARLFEKNLGANWQERLRNDRKGDGSPMFRSPFKNGDAADCKEADGKWKAGFGPGVVYLRASSLYKPGIVDGQKKEIMNPNEVYGGAYYRAQVHFYWYNHPAGGQGVTCGLDNVQKIRDGEMLGGNQKAEDAFEAIEQPGGAVPAAAGASSEPWAGL